MQTITDTLRQFRMHRNYTQEYIAYKLGISQSQYNKIEKGESPLTVERLLQIGKIFEAEKEELIEKIFNVNMKNVKHYGGEREQEDEAQVSYYKMLALHYEKKFMKLYKRHFLQENISSPLQSSI